MTLSPDLKQEAIRLRVEERFSLDDVQARTGISIATLSVLLRPYPLAADEVFAKKSASALRNNPLRKYNPEPSKLLQMVNIEELSTDRKGRIAEAAVMFRLAILGYEVLRSVFEGLSVDCFAYNSVSGKIARIQIKWSRRAEHGRPFFQIWSDEKNKFRSQERFDFIVGYDFETDIAFVFPSEVLGSKRYKTCDEEYAEAWHLLGI